MEPNPSVQQAEASRPRARDAWRRWVPEWVARWIGIFSAYFSTQTVTQLAGIAAGILLINFMPLKEFALYTLASSAISFFTFVSDLGSSASLVYFFRESKGQSEEFKPYVGAVLSLRRRVFVLGVIVVSIFLPALALQRGFRPAETFLALGGVIVCVWFQIRTSLRLLVLRLEGRYGQAYGAELAGSLLRLVFAAILVATALLWGWLAVATVAVATAVSASLARRGRIDAIVEPEKLARSRRAVIRYLLPTLPAAFYFAVQGPLSVWLSATFGKTQSIAEVGALGRLGLVVGLFSGLTGIVFLPRLARITDERLYRRRFLQFGLGLLTVAVAILCAATLLPGAFLFILGPHYRGLRHELLFAIGTSGFTLLDGYLVSVNLARSWTRFQALALAIQIALQVFLMIRLPLGSTANVMLFSLLSAAIAFLLQAVTAAIGFRRPQWLHWK